MIVYKFKEIEEGCVERDDALGGGSYNNPISLDRLNQEGADGWHLVWMSPDRMSALLQREE